MTTSGATAAGSTFSRGLSPATESASSLAQAQEDNAKPLAEEDRPLTSLSEQGQEPQEETPAGEIQERAVRRKLPWM